LAAQLKANIDFQFHLCSLYAQYLNKVRICRKQHNGRQSKMTVSVF